MGFFSVAEIEYNDLVQEAMPRYWAVISFRFSGAMVVSIGLVVWFVDIGGGENFSNSALGSDCG